MVVYIKAFMQCSDLYCNTVVYICTTVVYRCSKIVHILQQWSTDALKWYIDLMKWSTHIITVVHRCTSVVYKMHYSQSHRKALAQHILCVGHLKKRQK